jgi:cytoskeletal protein CcmA (bactofilin family)
VVNGVFKGSAESDAIDILPRGNVKGKLIYTELTIEKGAAFEGETVMRSATNSQSEDNSRSKRSTDNKLELLPSSGNRKKS